jgi:hypothetical protein
LILVALSGLDQPGGCCVQDDLQRPAGVIAHVFEDGLAGAGLFC